MIFKQILANTVRAIDRWAVLANERDSYVSGGGSGGGGVGGLWWWCDGGRGGGGCVGGGGGGVMAVVAVVVVLVGIHRMEERLGVVRTWSAHWLQRSYYFIVERDGRDCTETGPETRH